MTKIEKAAGEYRSWVENHLIVTDGDPEKPTEEWTEEAFSDGADWAIEEACKWLLRNTELTEAHYDGEDFYVVIIRDCGSKVEFVERFKNAMEE